MPYNVRDSLAKTTRALTASAGTAYSTAIDLGLVEDQDDFLSDVEFLLTAPAVNATMAPDTRTFKYSIVTDPDSTLDGSSTVLFADVITQTGASSAGAASESYRFRVPSTVARYIGIKVVGGTSTGDASTVSATLEVLF